MSNKTEKQSKNEITIKEHLQSDAFREKVEAALPAHLTPDRFVGVALTCLTQNPDLEKCTQKSLFKCLLQLSQLGLEPDGRRAYLIPYGDECTLQLDYKGIVELVLRNGDVSRIHAAVVYLKEYDSGDFVYDRGKVTTHRKSLDSDLGKVIAVYAEVEFKDGTSKAEMMRVDEVEAVRSSSKMKNSGPWTKHWNEMAKKTAFRRLAKWLPLSPEVRQKIEIDDDQFENMKRAKAVQPVRPMLGGANKEIAGEVVAEVAQIEPDTGEATT